MAPIRGSAPATGWWSRPTRATAPSCGCRRRRHRHQHGSRAPGPLGHGRGDEGRLRAVRRQHSVLWFRGALPRPPRGAGDDPASSTAASSPTASRRRPMCARRSCCTDRKGATFDVAVQDRAHRRAARTMKPMRLPMLGQHNVQNALAAIAVGVEMDIDEDTIRSALAGFKGVKRRFTHVGEAGGITVIDDYGHHPVEIAAVLKAAAAGRRARRDRGGAAAPLFPPGDPVRGILHLHERCRHGDRRRRLCRRRGADRGHRQGRAGRRPARARPSQRGRRCPARTRWPRWCNAIAKPATSSSASAPAASPTGRMPCRTS